MKESTKSILKRLRYDRLFLTLALVLFLFVGIPVLLLRDDEAEEAVPAAAETDTTDPPTSEPPKVFTVFLSPSNQTDNLYAGFDDVTEASAMRTVAEAAMETLEAAGIVVYLAEEADGLNDKIDKANGYGVDAYVAIHSNAGGTSGYGTGTEAYYNPNIPASLTLAQQVYDAVAAATPTSDRGLADGTGETDENKEYREVRRSEVPCCFVEVEFHDQEQYARWIVDNAETLGEAIAQGILNYKEEAEG